LSIFSNYPTIPPPQRLRCSLYPHYC
jgi:hypothetical protein